MFKRLVLAAVLSTTLAACSTSPTAPGAPADAALSTSNGGALGSGV